MITLSFASFKPRNRKIVMRRCKVWWMEGKSAAILRSQVPWWMDCTEINLNTWNTIKSSVMLNSDFPDGQFIFKESEFEEETFAAAAFVAKYRRVSSLESIKEQLQQYSNGLKQQLYNIINRDYKDFITISTKLDGVDTRTSLLQKPLVDVRSDLTSLHEGILTGMQAIQEKVKHRVEVANRRKLVETFLQCLNRLEATESVLNASTGVGAAQTAETGLGSEAPANCGRPSQRSRLLRAMDRRLAIAGSSNNSGSSSGTGLSTITSVLLLEKDVFVCSELERASSCLASVDGSLATLLHHINTSTAPSDDDASLESADSKSSHLQSRSAVLSMYKALEKQARAHRELLIHRVHSHLTHLLTNSLGGAVAGDVAPVGGSSGTTSSSGAHRSPSALRSRSFAHCLRALCTLGRGEVAEELVRGTVVAPYLRSFLTLGRVDGKGGRGSYSGLEEALQSVLDTLSTCTSTTTTTNTTTTTTTAAAAPAPAAPLSSSPSFLLTCLQVGEGVLTYAPSTDADEPTADKSGTATSITTGTTTTVDNKRSVDLVVHGVWQPLTELLSERFGEMFSVGIPSTLSHCYRCLTRFLQKLQALCGAAHVEAVGRRLHGHPLVTSFFARWKLDLYFQLRCKEVFTRVDRACEATLRGGLTSSSTKHLAEELYNKADTGSATTGAGAGAVSSLTAADCAALKAEVDRQLTLQVPMFVAFAVELRTCLHPSVLLQPLVAKFLTLILRTLMRLEAHVALSCSVTTPSFPGKADLEALRLVYAATADASVTASGPGAGPAAVASTPAKRIPGAAATPASAPAANAALTPGSAAPLVLSVLALEELLLVAGDLHSLEGWLLAEFSTSAAAALGAKQAAGSVSSFQIDLQGVDAVRAALVRQVSKLHGAREEIWTRITALLGGECRKALGAVKTAVVSKYRMTNKPPPESPSAYVEAILLPLRSFLGQHAALAEKLSSSGDGRAKEREAGEGLRRWKIALAEEVSLSYVEQVSALIETVKQMDSTLQRRSRLQASSAGAGNTGNNMSDSEKIALQIRLDVEAFGRELQQLGVDTAQVPAFKALSDLSVDTNN